MTLCGLVTHEDQGVLDGHYYIEPLLLVSVRFVEGVAGNTPT